MLFGEVEADETFIGQKARNMHKDVRRARSPEPAAKTNHGHGDSGAWQRRKVQQGSHQRRFQPEEKSSSSELRKHVEAGAAIYTML